MDFALVDNSAPAGTAYCFRVVRSDDQLFDSCTVVPQITTYVPNIAPNQPTALAQKTTGDVVINTHARSLGQQHTIRFTQRGQSVHGVEIDHAIMTTNAYSGYQLSQSASALLTSGAFTVPDVQRDLG